MWCDNDDPSRSVFCFRYYRPLYSLSQTSISLRCFWHRSFVVWAFRLWLSTIGVQDVRMLPSVSQRAQSLVLSSSFFSLHLSPLFIETQSVSNQSFCRWHTTISLLSSWSGTRRCPDHAGMHLWHEDLDFTFSEDYKKFGTLQRNGSSNHTDVIMCNFFFIIIKLFIGYWSKPEQITNCQLSQSLLRLILCQPLWPSVYTPSRQLHSSADTRTLCIPIFRQKPLANFLLYCSNGFPNLLTSVTFSPPMPSKLR